MVMVGGFPIAGHVFRGNVVPPAGGMKEVVRDIEERFGIKRILFVADKGMVSKPRLRAGVNHRYILGHKGRRDKDAKRWLSKLTDRWRECSDGVRVQEVESGKEELRVLVVESDERKEYEKRQHQRSMKRAEEHLKAEVTREGRYILTTNHPRISPEEAVAHYKEVSDIEAGFREHGFVIRGRPYPTTNGTTASALTSSSPS